MAVAHEFWWISEFFKISQSEDVRQIESRPALQRSARKELRTRFRTVEALEEFNKKNYDLYQSWPLELQQIVAARPAHLSFDAYLEIARILKPAPTDAAKLLLPDDGDPSVLKFRERRLWTIIEQGSKGLAYCREVEHAGVRIRGSWQHKGCPATYTAAFQEKKWRHAIADEKSKIRAKGGPGKHLR